MLFEGSVTWFRFIVVSLSLRAGHAAGAADAADAAGRICGFSVRGCSTGGVLFRNVNVLGETKFILGSFSSIRVAASRGVSRRKCSSCEGN
jgi:hypothetical protein